MPVLFIDEMVICTDSLMVKKDVGTNIQTHPSDSEIQTEFPKGHRAEFTTHNEQILQKAESRVNAIAAVEDAIIYLNNSTLFIDEYTFEIGCESTQIDCAIEFESYTMFKRRGNDE